MLMCTYSFRSSDRPWKAPGMMVLIKLFLSSLGKVKNIKLSCSLAESWIDDTRLITVQCSSICLKLVS